MKIDLGDYDSSQDMRHRIYLSKFSDFEMTLLQEILFSSVKIAKKKLAKALNVSDEKALDVSLNKLQEMDLISIELDTIIVDKTQRKIIEFEMMKFEEGFYPDMRFFQALLKKVPIHLLPVWYAIPKTTDNIFESILEKYLLTPNLFQRTLGDFFSNKDYEPSLKLIVEEVFNSPSLSMTKEAIQKKYRLDDEKLEEYLLFLEFNCLCSVIYTKKNQEKFSAEIVPFKEWKDYLLFLKQTEPKSIEHFEKISNPYGSDFIFIECLEKCLKLAKKKPISIQHQDENFSLPSSSFHLLETHFPKLALQENERKTFYLKIFEKLSQLKLGEMLSNQFYALESSNAWLDLSLEEKALFLYRHPLNQPYMTSLEKIPLYTDRHLREAEKSLKRVLESGWIFFSDFLKSLTVSLSDKSTIMLKRQGSLWHYVTPIYSDDDHRFMKRVVFDWLFEMGVIKKGFFHGNECFCVTDFGRKLFAR